MAYLELIKADGRGFYKKTNWNSMNITFNKLLIFRLVNASDIFNNASNCAYITLSIRDVDKVFNLEIEMEIPNIKDSYIRFKNQNKLEDFNSFADYCKDNHLKLKEVISINLTKPVSSILKNEEFLNKAKIEKSTYLGHSNQVLRNKILATRENEKFDYLESKLSNVLGKSYKIRFKNKNREDDEFIRITIHEEDSCELDVSLVGSGLLHILEIFSSVYVNESNQNHLNLLLIDEPDSHMHSDIQSKLIDELKNDEYRQIFIISHNDRFIDKTQTGELFYLNRFSKRNKQLVPADIKYFSKIKEELGGNLYQLEQMNLNKPTVFVEGESDKAILIKAMEYHKPELIAQIDIQYDNGYNWVKDMLIAWHLMKKTNKAIGLFDYDNDTLDAITKVNNTIENHRNTKVFKLHDYKPQHLIDIFSKQIKIPFAIEEMFPHNIWEQMESNQYLELKTDIQNYNTNFNPMNQTFKNYCEEKGLSIENMIYFNKVKVSKKEDACKFIIENAVDFDCFNQLIDDIESYLLNT
jgi:predicted ATP-dependent endonuclease of OLD family